MWENRGRVLDKFGLDQTGKIQYKFNNQGFRANKDYCDQPNIVFFGCSLVFGIGVSYDKTFTAQFHRSHNYGLAGDYDNIAIYQIIMMWLKSDSSQTCVNRVVVWSDRDNAMAQHYAQCLLPYGFVNFFCGVVPGLDNCYAMPPKKDLDISSTHMGPRSHKLFYKILCPLFDL